ncbi:DUF742 domain-containing protein [Actinomadura sp. 7K507]|uniref:DUF742 domain-containing protein n=1 Tax=Actinomadura sp. 7K507 TaxID=2530365 RepID=UPI00104C8046|nr:DUF742 domain-containing protein [Actinomadura sp. 7K507]TDC91956.1 DUF742 domain-containing protein [Actinomadura sp. 7K507]
MSSDPRPGAQPGAQASARRGAQVSPVSQAWVDQDVQQLRPYVVVADGRAAPRHQMRVDTVLTATNTARTSTDRTGTGGAGGLVPEAAHALGLCRAGGCSVAEIAATIDQPILVTKTLLSNLIDDGALVIALPAAQPDLDTGRPSPHLLQALLEGLKAS